MKQMVQFEWCNYPDTQRDHLHLQPLMLELCQKISLSDCPDLRGKGDAGLWETWLSQLSHWLTANKVLFYYTNFPEVKCYLSKIVSTLEIHLSL